VSRLLSPLVLFSMLAPLIGTASLLILDLSTPKPPSNPISKLTRSVLQAFLAPNNSIHALLIHIYMLILAPKLFYITLHYQIIATANIRYENNTSLFHIMSCFSVHTIRLISDLLIPELNPSLFLWKSSTSHRWPIFSTSPFSESVQSSIVNKSYLVTCHNDVQYALVRSVNHLHDKRHHKMNCSQLPAFIRTSPTIAQLMDRYKTPR